MIKEYFWKFTKMDVETKLGWFMLLETHPMLCEQLFRNVTTHSSCAKHGRLVINCYEIPNSQAFPNLHDQTQNNTAEAAQQV